MPATTIAFGARRRCRAASAATARRGRRPSCSATAYAQIADPAAEPAVGAAHQPAAPLVGAAGDRELRRELGVDREQQALAGERDRQHPDPRRARRRRCRRRRRRRGRRPARSRRSPSRRCRRTAGAGRAPAGSRARASRAASGSTGGAAAVTPRQRRPRAPRSTARATSTREEHAELDEDVAQVRLDRLVAQEQRRRRSRGSSCGR